jgi:CO/xanthine dehydrogenase FAD-binding subunit
MVETYRPTNLREALGYISQQKTAVVAGGTDLMVKHRMWRGLSPLLDHPVLFIGHLPELQRIDINNNKISIGAGCSLNQILKDFRVPDFIKKPISSMASPGVRNLATIGGNICNSSPAGDTLPMLYALNAKLKCQSLDQTTYIDVSDFIIGPGKNRLQPNQLLTDIEIPLQNYTNCYYRKIGTRKANSISKVSIFAVAQLDSVYIKTVSVALGAVAPTVVRSIEAEQLLRGVKRSDVPTIYPDVKEYYVKAISPVDDIRSNRRYRQQVVLNLVHEFVLKELAR